MFDVVSLGELLIDFTPSGKAETGHPRYEQNPGGAPANVAAAVSKLGGKSAFIGKVGGDSFGRFLKETLIQKKVEAKGLRFAADNTATTLAFVHLDKNGDRSFSFCRSPGADTTLEPGELDLSLIGSAKIFHFGSLSLTAEPARSATFEAVKYAKQKGCLISYDPNLRLALWPDTKTAKAAVLAGLRYADILKISGEELSFITGTTGYERGSKMLFDRGLRLVVITLGPDGCFYRYKNGVGYITTYDTRVIDTTGSGDAFTGAMLYNLAKRKKPLEDIPNPEMIKLLTFANAAGALCATKHGAIPALPDKEEIRTCMKEITKLGK